MDEAPRDTSLEKLATLKTPFRPHGRVTAGNSAGLNDGATGCVIAARDVAAELGLDARMRLVDFGFAGVDPEVMGIGPVPATRSALKQAGLTVEDVDLFEINEAFAGQYLAVEKELGNPREKTNVNGGAIALGHPLAATGTRLILTLLCELRRRKKRWGVATACIGGGQGIAAVVEAIP